MLLRVRESQWSPFINALIARQDVETAAVILAERLDGGEVLLAKHLIMVPDDGYLIRRSDQLRLDPVALNRLIRCARDEGLSVLTIHTHPGTSEPWFSLADDAGDARLIPSLFAQMPGPHGSLVVAGESGMVAGRVWSECGVKTDLRVRTVGVMLRARPATSPGRNPTWFERQQLALGESGQAVLHDLHIGVVGLGGTGSVVLVQLAHLGVGRITVVDGDLVERSNVSRILGATTCDAGITPKVAVALRYVESVGLGTRVQPIQGHLGQHVSVADIESCDVVLSCVDRHTPRALLNRLAYDKAIPTIDMGSAFRANGEGRIVASAGRVVIVGPGRRCLACWGHIDPDVLRIEALPPVDRASQILEGYIRGADVPQPSVVSFNTMIAGAAVIELLRLVTGFAGSNDSPARLSFDFESGTVRRNRLDSTPCSICGSVDPPATGERAGRRDK